MARPTSSTPTRMTARIGKASANSIMALPRLSAHSPIGRCIAPLRAITSLSIELHIVTEHDLVGVAGLHRIVDFYVDRSLIIIVADVGVVAGGSVARRLGHESLGELGNVDTALTPAQFSGLLAAVHDGNVESAPERPQRRRSAALATAADVGSA